MFVLKYCCSVYFAIIEVTLRNRRRRFIEMTVGRVESSQETLRSLINWYLPIIYQNMGNVFCTDIGIHHYTVYTQYMSYTLLYIVANASMQIIDIIGPNPKLKVQSTSTTHTKLQHIDTLILQLHVSIFVICNYLNIIYNQHQQQQVNERQSIHLGETLNTKKKQVGT